MTLESKCIASPSRPVTRWANTGGPDKDLGLRDRMSGAGQYAVDGKESGPLLALVIIIGQSQMIFQVAVDFSQPKDP